MIIIPTEKRFDWAHAPVVLFILVAINIIVFFMYQSGDDEKIGKAITSYNDLGYLQAEWPIYKKYLKYKKKNQELSNYRRLYHRKEHFELSYYLLMETNFSKYVYQHRIELVGIKNLDVWQSNREKIYLQLRSASNVAYGLIPSEARLVTFITSQFLHGGVMHLLGNLFFLVICGFAVEAAIGHYRFLIFYLVSGIAGGLLHMALNPNSTTTLVGASGAISGVMAMYLGVFRFKKIEFFYWLFIFVGYFRAPALLILPFYIGKEVINYYSGGGSNVAFMAHTGGFVGGITLMFLFLYIDPKMLNEEYIEDDQTIDPVQNQLAKVYAYIGNYQFEAALKVLNEIIEDHGINFERALIRYNLLKPAKNKAYLQSIVSLLKMEKLEDHQVASVELIWRKNPMLHKLIKSDNLVKLGWRLSVLPDVSAAEEIFDRLQKDNHDNNSLAAFAKRLSVVFDEKNNNKKKKYYQALSSSLI